MAEYTYSSGFCRAGHEVRVTGVTKSGRCRECDLRNQRAGHERRRQTKHVPFVCKHGHDTAVSGMTPTGRCQECHRLTQVRWLENPDNIQLQYAATRLWRLKRWGLTRSAFHQLLEEQGGVCAICQQRPPLRHNRRQLHIDHHHATGQRRGFLCQKCNLGVGQFQDSVELLKAAITYLEYWDAAKEGNVEASSES